MKKIITIVLIGILFIPILVFASNKKVNAYLFYGDGCPHCAAEEKFFDEYLKKEKDVKLYKYEVWYDEENQNKLAEIQKIIDKPSKGVPYLVIGEEVITGFSEDITEERIKNTIEYYKTKKFVDKVGIFLGLVEEEPEESTDELIDEPIKKTEEFDIPLIGKKKANEVPLLLSSIVIGLVDGFNPCAMWILIFLISMLIGMENKKRKWILGITFLITSALVYFLFMISWLNLVVFLNKIIYIRMAISLVAVIFGSYSIIKFLTRKDDGCEVVNTSGRKSIIKSINKIVKEKTFILAILGIMVLAISVNIIELLCSLGLPVLFTEILALNDISKTMQIIYIIIYVFFFLIDDLIVFIIAMKTMEIKAISNKYGAYSHLIGGIIMLLIGVLMLLKPEWIMFNF